MIAQLCGRLAELVVSSVIYVSTLREHDEEVKRYTQFITALHNLKVATFQKATRFLNQVHEITLHCGSESEMMRAARTGVNSEFNAVVRRIQTPDFGPLNDIINHWTQNMSMAQSCYKEFEDDCGIVITSCTEAAEICRYKAKEATDRRPVVKVIGVVAVVISIAVVAVGVLTSGFGFEVVASVVAVGAATATVYNMHEMEQSNKAFSSIGMQVGSLLDASRDMKNEVGPVERDLMRVSVLLDNLVHRRNNHESISSIRDALNDMSKTGPQVHQTIPSCRRRLESIVNKLH